MSPCYIYPEQQLKSLERRRKERISQKREVPSEEKLWKESREKLNEQHYQQSLRPCPLVAPKSYQDLLQLNARQPAENVDARSRCITRGHKLMSDGQSSMQMGQRRQEQKDHKQTPPQSKNPLSQLIRQKPFSSSSGHFLPRSNEAQRTVPSLPGVDA